MNLQNGIAWNGKFTACIPVGFQLAIVWVSSDAKEELNGDSFVLKQKL